MAATVRDTLGGVFARPPATWTPAPCPDLTDEPWHGVPVPWRTPITDAPVDAARTALLATSTVDTTVDVGATGDMWNGSVAGMPFQLIDGTGPLTERVNVIDRSQPSTYRWQWTWPFVVAQPVTVPVDMPPVLRREGDPLGAWDCHAYLLDRRRNRLVEMITVDSFPAWSAGYDGSGRGVIEWDLGRPFDAPGQPHGVVAAGIPHMPHFIRCDELARREVRHAAFLALPNYAPGRTGYARSSDGTDAAHPCRAGERLRLRARVLDRFRAGTPERTVAVGLATYGAVVGDRTMHGVASTSGPGVIAATQDPRWKQFGWRGLNLRLSDFEIITQP